MRTLGAMSPNAPTMTEQGTMLPTAASVMRPVAGAGGQLELAHADEHVPELVWPACLPVYDQMVNSDARLAALMTAFVTLIMRRRYELEDAGASEDDARRIAEDLGVRRTGSEDPEPVRGRGRVVHRELLQHALLALRYGSYWFEMVGEEVSDQSGKAWRLHKLAPRPTRTLEDILVDDSGGLLGIRQEPRQMARTGITIGVESLVGFVWGREGANWYGKSLLRPVHLNWYLKRMALQADGVQKRRNSLGIPTFTPGADAGTEVVAAYNAIGKRLAAGEEVSVTHADPGGKFELTGVTGSLPNALETARFHNEEYAANFMAMWMQLGQTQTGSRALGDTFMDVFDAVLDSIAEDWYCGTVNEYVIRDWMLFNYGPDHGRPMPRLVSRRTEDAKLAAVDFIAAIEKGVLSNGASLEEWFRGEYNLPALADETDPYTAPVAAPAAVPGQLVAAQHQHDDVVHAGALDDGPTSRQRWRELTDREIRAGIDPEAMDQRWRDAAARLVSAWPVLRRPQIDALLAQIEAAAGDYVALSKITAPVVGADELAAEMRALAQDASREVVREAKAQGAKIASVDLAAVETAITDRARATVTMLAGDLARSAAGNAIRLTNTASDASKVAQDVRTSLEALSDSGLAQRLTGALTAAQNDARGATITQGPEPTSIVATEIMDSNTCGPCAEIDGTEYASVDEAEADYPGAGYIDCEGGDQCRGFYFAEYGGN